MVVCPKCGAAVGESCHLMSGTLVAAHAERESLARPQRSAAEDESDKAADGANPLRVEVIDRLGNVLRFLPASYSSAERMKRRLITELHESGRRDEMLVRIVDLHGEPW